MPIKDLECRTCDAIEEDVLVRRGDDEPPPCPSCGGQRKALVSRFGTVFMGSLRKYTDLKREGASEEGFWAYRRKSSVSGQPEPVYLTSVQEVRDFNKSEGLAPPGDIPTNSTISADGKRIVSNGMPGQWSSGVPELPARMREMLAKPDNEFSCPPATATPAMPMDHGMRAEAVEVPTEIGG
jgi:predicted nucleic acid-binding Zn ribbon protein